MGIYYKYLDTSKQATFYLRFFMPAPLSCSSFLKICFFRLDIWLILAEIIHTYYIKQYVFHRQQKPLWRSGQQAVLNISNNCYFFVRKPFVLSEMAGPHPASFPYKIGKRKFRKHWKLNSSQKIGFHLIWKISNERIVWLFKNHEMILLHMI